MAAGFWTALQLSLMLAATRGYLRWRFLWMIAAAVLRSEVKRSMVALEWVALSASPHIFARIVGASAVSFWW